VSKFYVPTTGTDSWRALLADPDKQWQTGFSAKAIASCWEAEKGLPEEIARLFGGDAELLVAFPEHKVDLGDGHRESQNDVFALVKSSGRTIAVAVEGKVNETFGPTIEEWYRNPSTAKQQRLAFLCDLIGIGCPPPGTIRYQLLHRTASALLEARRFKTDDAAMIIHSFSVDDTGLGDYRNFLALMGLSANPGQMVSKVLATGQTLRCGWAKGNLHFLSA
jgi:hypothetical protein